ncbi:hypothetical protein CYLTODRAFT_414142 [Cylindrobasidium torrendii FP15055 ss-10]|uniref:Uncharacterized protein n=1 Tax=Cylindrobasidium torrendii FP15055 ss-10 TaxID=1314674 RepID=A0A0D7AY29_9AGAR|nr:hypothetical protein CYLTODRAFT_414142 [Cylindrobasidium torrendii FP15055 ss-10]
MTDEAMPTPAPSPDGPAGSTPSQTPSPDQPAESTPTQPLVDKPVDVPAEVNIPVVSAKKGKKRNKEYEQRVQELFQKYMGDYEKAFSSDDGKCGDVIARVVNEAEFQFDYLFNPLCDPEAPPPPMPKLKDYDPLTPLPDVSWSKAQIKKRKKAVDKWAKASKARNYFYYAVHVIKPENDRKKPTKIGAAMNGLIRPSKARAGYQLFEVEHGKELGEEIARLWETRSAEEKQQDEKEHAERNAQRVANGSKPQAKRDGPSISFRQSIVRKRFEALSVEEREDFDLRAKADAKERRDAYEEAVKKPIDHSPEQRQKAIDNIGTLVSPLIEDIRRHTGLHIIVSAYGPIPATQGQLGVLTWSAGRNRDAMPVSFLKKCPGAAAAHRARLLAYAATAFTDKDIAAACPAPDSPLSRVVQGSTEFELDDDAAVRAGDMRRKDVHVRKNHRHTNKETGLAGSEQSEKGGGRTQADAGGQRIQTVTTMHPLPEKTTDGPDDDDIVMDLGDGEDSGSRKDVPSPPKKPKLPSYEQDREMRMAANHALLESMGLISAAKTLHKKMGSQKKKRTRKAAAVVEPRRRSSRLQAEQNVATASAGEGEAGQASQSPTSSARAHTPAQVPADISHPTPRQSPSPQLSDARPNPDATNNEPDVADVDKLEMDEDAILEEATEVLIEAPPYLTDTLRRMKEKDVGMLGRRWDVFLARLLLLESEGEFNMPLKDLPAGSAKDGTQRPPMLGTWMKIGRCRRNADNVPKEMPLLAPGDLKGHVAAFLAWWGMLQPGWRRYENGQWVRGGYDESVGLGDLNTRGTCGWLSVVACMWWWGVCVHEGEDEAAKRVWASTLEDVDWMLMVVLVLGEREGKE